MRILMALPSADPDDDRAVVQLIPRDVVYDRVVAHALMVTCLNEVGRQSDALIERPDELIAVVPEITDWSGVHVDVVKRHAGRWAADVLEPHGIAVRVIDLPAEQTNRTADSQHAPGTAHRQNDIGTIIAIGTLTLLGLGWSYWLSTLIPPPF